MTAGAGGSSGGGPPGAGGTTGGAGPDGSAGTGGSGGDAGPSIGTLGGACKANTDCAVGLICLKSTDNLVPGAGPPNGICTASCAGNPALCQPFGGICVTFDTAGTSAYCIERCTIGSPPAGATKCHNRQDSTCEPFGTAAAPTFGCVPLCLSDADCGTRKCDLGTGLCADRVSTGAGIGAACTVDTDCAGLLCIPVASSDGGPTPGVCSAFCHLGSVQGCSYRSTPLDAGPAVGGCILGADTGYGLGDLGFCLQLCDAPADCSLKYPGWTCVQNASVIAVFHHGACIFPQSD
jgi:hypothetical protein